MLLCCTTDVSLEFPTMHQRFSFVPLVSRFHWKVQRSVYVLHFDFFKRFLMVCVSWLELSLTDAVVKFISIILCCRSYICLVHKVLLLRHLLFKGHLDLFIHICSCLSWWLWVCHCLVMYVDSWFHVWHTTVANFHIFLLEIFKKLMVWWKVFVTAFIRRIKPNYFSFPLLFWGCGWGIF